MAFAVKLLVQRTAAIAAALLAAAIAGCSPAPENTAPKAAPQNAGHVNVYSGRHYDSDLDLYDAFTAATGVKVNLIEAGGNALIERLANEGEATPADLFITADAGMLWRAQSRDLLQPTTHPAILAKVPEQFRHPDGDWVGLSKRARIIIYNKQQGLPEGVEDYEDLADPAYKGMICIRSSSNIYNQSLLASIIANDGSEAAENWARGVVANFARQPQGTDISQIEAVAAGVCRLGVVNSYYLARFLDPSDKKAYAIGEKVGAIFPNQGGRGTHINISGAGVTKYAANVENAEKLIAFLLRDESQKAFALGNNEYPVVEEVEPQGPILKLGEFKADTLDAAMLGEHQAEAVMIFDRAGWR